MDDKELFNLVKDDDEEILKIIRPNKSRTYANVILFALSFTLMFIFIAIAGFTESVETGVAVLVGILIFVIVFSLITLPFYALWLNKTVYAITNKRILIRTGYIGVDYKSLDYTMLGAITVNVSWLDKLLRKDTGSISFGSTASPMVNNNVARFAFNHIKNPYGEYKEIKAIIDKHQAK